MRSLFEIICLWLKCEKEMTTRCGLTGGNSGQSLPSPDIFQRESCYSPLKSIKLNIWTFIKKKKHSFNEFVSNYQMMGDITSREEEMRHINFYDNKSLNFATDSMYICDSFWQKYFHKVHRIWNKQDITLWKPACLA